ncbi:MAG: hypothetical protein QNK18_03215 [Gammaproteobacteria bacterium]|nr:hypothetical protein [Gammaproteobacteria bacterium]
MIRTMGFTTLACLVVSSGLYAQDSLLLSLQKQTNQQQWRSVDAGMSAGSYKNVMNHNRRLAADTLSETIQSLGVPKVGIAIMGAATALAVSDVKVPLNRSKTLGLRIDDAAEEDRSALIEVKLKW